MEAGDYQIEYAKSGRARCRLTNKTIPNKALRIGEIVEGEYGTYPRWMNFDDFEMNYEAVMAFKNSGTTLHGLKSLKPKDKERYFLIFFFYLICRVNKILSGTAIPPVPSVSTVFTVNPSSMTSPFCAPMDSTSRMTPSFSMTSSSTHSEFYQQQMELAQKLEKKKKNSDVHSAPMFTAPRPTIQQAEQFTPPPRKLVPVQQAMPTFNQEPFTSMTPPKNPDDIHDMMNRLTPIELQLVLSRLVMNDPQQLVTVKKQCLQIIEARNH